MLVIASGAIGRSSYAQAPIIPARGVEETGRVYIGEPVANFIGHMAMLFVTGKHPTIGAGTMQDTIDWVNSPLHSSVADGTGGLAVYAHPDSASRVLLWNGLTGMEVFHERELPSASPYRDQMWDAVNRSLYAQGKPLLWGFAADDTHSTQSGNFNLSRNVALVPAPDLFSLKAALRGGAFYTTNGPGISAVSVSGTSITITAAQASDVLWLRAGQYNDGTSFTQDSTLGAGKAVTIDSGVSISTLDISQLGLAASDIHFVRAIVRTSGTTYALTQPFLVSASSAISNPYPASGIWVAGQSHNHDDATIGTGGARLSMYRSNYQAVGEQASFETAYSYWEVPYQGLESDGYPDVTSVSPGKAAGGTPARITVTGVNFADGITVQMGEYALTDIVLSGPTQLSGAVPPSLPPGTYDVVLTNPDGLRGTAADAVVVQEATADNTGWTSYQSPNLPWNQTTSIEAIGAEVWVGTLQGAARYKEGAWSSYIPTGGQNAYSKGVYDIIADPSGGIWFSSEGIWYQTPAGTFPWTYTRPTNGATSERWGRMAFDHAGQLWVMSRWGEGLEIRSPSGAWTRWTKANNGMPLDDEQTVAADAQGNVWVGFAGGYGVWKWTGSAWQQVVLPSPVNTVPDPLAIVAGRNGDMWVAVAPRNISYTPAQAGVVRFRADGTTDVLQSPPLPQPRITDILAASSGDVWFASRGGVARLDTLGHWRTFTAANSGLVSDIVMSMAEDATGRIWFATANGVSVYSPFDFGLSSAGDISVTPGALASTDIDVSLVTEPAQPVSFSVSGVPSGVSASFSQTSCTPACSTTLTVTASAGAIAGQYPLTVTGAASGSTRTTSVVLTVEATLPAAPTGLAADAISSTEIALSWTDTASNESGFRIERSPDGTTFAEIATVGANVTAYGDGELTPATTYTYRVRAYNDGGSSPYSNLASATTIDVPPSAPANLTATATSSTQIALVWVDTSTNETGFRIERSADGTTFAQIATVGANVTSYVSSGLAASTTYVYRVRAYSGGGTSAYSNTASATTLMAPPTDLTASLNNRTITLRWIDNSNDEDGFQIERAINNGPYSLLATVGPNVTTYTDTGLATKTTYRYRVRAFNSTQVSAYSNITSVKTKPK